MMILPQIYADEHGLIQKDLTERIIGVFFEMYNELGHGWSGCC